MCTVQSVQCNLNSSVCTVHSSQCNVYSRQCFFICDKTFISLTEFYLVHVFVSDPNLVRSKNVKGGQEVHGSFRVIQENEDMAHKIDEFE